MAKKASKKSVQPKKTQSSISASTKPSKKSISTGTKKEICHSEPNDGFLYVRTPIVVTNPDLLPKYQTAGSACADLYAVVPEKMGEYETGGKVTLTHRMSVRIKTGIKVAVPAGFKLCVAARSSFAERGLLVSNAPAQIDSDYRGEVEVVLMNCGREIIDIKNGDRFAQCWCERVHRFDWELVDSLDETERGEGGFGSTSK